MEYLFECAHLYLFSIWFNLLCLNASNVKPGGEYEPLVLTSILFSRGKGILSLPGDLLK